MRTDLVRAEREQGIKKLAAVLVLATTFVIPAESADPGRIAAAEQALEEFVRRSCHEGSAESLVAPILLYADVLEPVLLRLLADGPDATARAAERTTLETAWKRRQSFLEMNPELGLSPAERSLAHSVTKDDFVDRGLADFDAAWHERAIVGLAAIGSPEALETLRDLARTSDAGTQQSIGAVLHRFQPSATDADGGAVRGLEPGRTSVPRHQRGARPLSGRR